MDKVVWKPGTLEAPVPPALVTCGTMERPNVLTVAWTGIVNSKPAMTYISLRPERYSYGIVAQEGAFVINLPTRPLARAVDYCGCRSGRDEDKLAACRLEIAPASAVDCPLLCASPLALECRVRQRLPLGSHTMFLAEIVAVDVAQELLDASGKLHMEKAQLIAYAHGAYYALGQQLGTFGFSVRKRPRAPRGGARGG
nr:flavin reductase family protein [Maliibacterium massiliense]